MNYLLSQIWLCLGLVALIAGLAGWFLRGGSKAKIKALTEAWKVKLARAQNERDYYAGEVKSLSAMAEERENAEQDYQSEKQALSIQLDDMRVDTEKTSEAFKDQEHLLKQQASELEASNRALLASSDKQQRFQQKLMDSETDTEKTSVALRTAEEKISDLQTELDSTKIQLLDTTDKLSITEDLLAERQNMTAQEGQTILLVKDKEKADHSNPSPAPIQITDDGVQKNTILGVGSLLSTPTSSVEVVDAHDKIPSDTGIDLVEEKPIALPRDSQQASKQVFQAFVDDDVKVNVRKNADESISETDSSEPVEVVKTVKTTEQALDDAFSDNASDTAVATSITTTVKGTNTDTDSNSHQNDQSEQHNDDKQDDKTKQIDTDDNTDYKSKSATLAGAGAAALGMAGKMKDKLTQAKDDLLDKVDFASDVYAIQDIHTISNEATKYLRQMNVISTEDLIDKCASKEGVELIAKSMGKENWVVRSWVSMADLMRVTGVDAVNAELLELSGISSVQALASAKVLRLTDSIKVIHKHVGKTSHVPDSEEIEAWVKRAEGLPKRLDDHLDKL